MSARNAEYPAVRLIKYTSTFAKKNRKFSHVNKSIRLHWGILTDHFRAKQTNWQKHIFHFKALGIPTCSYPCASNSSKYNDKNRAKHTETRTAKLFTKQFSGDVKSTLKSFAWNYLYTWLNFNIWQTQRFFFKYIHTGPNLKKKKE